MKLIMRAITWRYCRCVRTINQVSKFTRISKDFLTYLVVHAVSVGIRHDRHPLWRVNANGAPTRGRLERLRSPNDRQEHIQGNLDGAHYERGRNNQVVLFSI